LGSGDDGSKQLPAVAKYIPFIVINLNDLSLGYKNKTHSKIFFSLKNIYCLIVWHLNNVNIQVQNGRHHITQREMILEFK
jgi:hypothetical protein